MGRADIWMGHLTALFDDPALCRWTSGRPYPSTGKATTRLILPAGRGFDVAVEPTDADIDGLLPITGFWPKF